MSLAPLIERLDNVGRSTREYGVLLAHVANFDSQGSIPDLIADEIDAISSKLSDVDNSMAVNVDSPVT